MLNNFCFHVYAQNSLFIGENCNASLSHSLILTLSLSHSLTLSFILSWHAEQLLFSCLCSKFAVYRWKCQCFFYHMIFLAGNQLYELQTHRWGWCWGCCCPKKSIAIFGDKQRLLSIDMKTKLVQHVESDWMRDWKSVRVRECVRVRAWECESDFWA